jgi:hypothetical protein
LLQRVDMNTVNSLKEQLKKLDQEYLNVAKLYPNTDNIISFEGDFERLRINSLKKEVQKKINALEGIGKNNQSGGRNRKTKKAKKSKKSKKTRKSKKCI